MANNHNWRIKRKYYNLINDGTKTLEVRVGYPDIKKVKQGVRIVFKDYSNTKFEVVRVTRYNNFREMLNTEDSSKAIPGVTRRKALCMYQEIYPNSKESLGVYVFELRKQTCMMKFYTLSSLTGNPKLFSKISFLSYCFTDHINKDYPKHFEWYYTKQIPRVLNGTGEIIICTNNNDIAGIIFLKHDETERKICTLFVSEQHRGKHIATMLLEKAFEYLGTTKPLITIADYKFSMFERIIKRYNWELTQTMHKGYYNNTSNELVFNGENPN